MFVLEMSCVRDSIDASAHAYVVALLEGGFINL